MSQFARAYPEDWEDRMAQGQAIHTERCARCGAVLTSWSMSKFNTDNCCFPCLEDEKLAPGYAAANEAEFQACKNGNYNFPGVGLSADDLAFLAKRRGERKP